MSLEEPSWDASTFSKNRDRLLAHDKANGQTARLSFSAHALMENRHGLLVDLKVGIGYVEREAAIEMLARQARKRVLPRTLGADKGYDTRKFVSHLRGRGITPHVTVNITHQGGSAIDGRTTRHRGYLTGQRLRKRVEEIFGWCKTVGGMRRSRFKGRDRANLFALIVGTAYNLTRMAKILREPAAA